MTPANRLRQLREEFPDDNGYPKPKGSWFIHCALDEAFALGRASLSPDEHRAAISAAIEVQNARLRDAGRDERVHPGMGNQWHLTCFTHKYYEGWPALVSAIDNLVKKEGGE